jgi:hypothetical protein
MEINNEQGPSILTLDFISSGTMWKITKYISTDEMVADLLTKALPAPRMKVFIQKLSIYEA